MMTQLRTWRGIVAGISLLAAVVALRLHADPATNTRPADARAAVRREPVRLAGSVRGADNQPRRGVKLDLLDASGSTVVTQLLSDARGDFVLRGIADGSYQLRAAAPEGPVLFENGKTLEIAAGGAVTNALVRLPAGDPPAAATTANRVLELDGQPGSTVQLPQHIFASLNEGTVEGWLRWSSFNRFSAFFRSGETNRELAVANLGEDGDLGFVTFSGAQNFLHVPRALRPNEWVHVAAVSGPNGMKLFVNGVLVASRAERASFDASGSSRFNTLGAAERTFHGAMDEVRVWAVERGVADIRANMFKRLTGREDGLVCLWNFDDPAEPVRDATPNKFNGRLYGDSQVIPGAVPASIDQVVQWAAISGAVTDADGRALREATVRLGGSDGEPTELKTDAAGNYFLATRVPREPWRLTANYRELSATPTNIVLREGAQVFNLTVRDATPLSGLVLAPDGSPIPTVVVQAVPYFEEDQPPVRPGLLAEFFFRASATNFPAPADKPDLRRVHPAVDFPFGMNTVIADRTTFAARWTGKLKISTADTYSFHLSADDAARLFIDGQPVVETARSVSDAAPAEKSASVELSAGEHELRLEMFNAAGREGCRLAWSTSAFTKEVIPTRVLSHRSPALPPITTVTDAKGRFRFPEMLPGDYTLRAQVPGRLVEFDDGRVITIDREKPLAEIDFRLRPFKKGQWSSYSHLNGLVDDSLACVFEAADGAMWFGANDGVSRFDGVLFSNFVRRKGMPDGRVTGIAQTPDGAMWFGTTAGLCRQDMKDGQPQFTTFTTAHGLPANAVTALLRDRNARLWIGTRGGLAYLDAGGAGASKPFVSAGANKAPLFAGEITALGFDASGALWIGHTNGAFRHEPRSPGILSNRAVTAVFAARDGTMWFGTVQDGVHRVTGTNAPVRFTAADGLADNRVTGIAQDADGAMWFATAGGGFSRYDGSAFVNYTLADGLPVASILALQFDSRGQLWAATPAGAVRFDHRTLTRFDERDGLDAGPVWCIVSTSDSNVWFQVGETAGKLSSFDGRRISKVTREDGLLGTGVSSLLAERDGSMLVGDARAAVSKYTPSTRPGERGRFETIENSGAASTLARAKSGQLWFGTAKNSGAATNIAAAKPLGPARLSRAAADGAVWFITHEGQLARHDGIKATVFAATNGLPDAEVRNLLPLDDGSVLVATMEGVVRFAGDKFTPWPANNARLNTVRCFDMTRDTEGRIWFGTAEGVFFTDGTAWTKLDERDGLPENAVNRVHRAADGGVWLGFWNRGLARYTPRKTTPRAPVLSVLTDREYTDLAKLPAVTVAQRVTFNFGVVDFDTAPGKRQFRWQVVKGIKGEGDLSPNWQAPGEQAHLEWLFPEPGPWTVAVQFIDRDLNYSKPVLATLTVVLPWHANAKIMIPAGCGVLALLGWAVFARLQYARKRREAEKLREQLFTEEQKARAAAEDAKSAAEEAKEAAEGANKAKSQFLANMSHELRTPLNAIIGYSEMVSEELEDLGVTDLKPDLEKVVAAAKHQLSLVNDILDLSKIEAGKMTLFLEDFDVAKMVHEVTATVKPLISKNANQLKAVVPSDIGTMRADLTKVRQTLFNLLSNASKFTEKGVITLKVAKVNSESVISKQSAKAGAPGLITDSLITFQITDTGIGMTPEQLTRLFEAFNQADASTTRKYGGTGLGLAISRKFCQLMGGDMTVTSEHGRGSTFSFTLPVEVVDTTGQPAAKPAAPAAAPAARTAAPPSRKTTAILVIDDDPNVRELMTRSLTKEGFSVHCAEDGKKGLEMARQLRPAVITLDVMMPGMDGWAVLTALKNDPALAAIPVIMLTMVDDKNIGFALGASEYFTKPIDFSKLNAALQKYGQPGTGKTVLLVEDDDRTREMLQRTLQKDGWRVVEAENGRRALERVAEEMPALVLLDLMMPEMDGFGFLTEFRKRATASEVPVVVITAKDLTAKERDRLNGEVSRVLQKGATNRDELLEQIRALAAKGSPAEPEADSP
jgi:signal transduction histidine kinase/CheY-like chemotaxis protein/ligand-binding sensor domain-containing protein